MPKVGGRPVINTHYCELTNAHATVFYEKIFRRVKCGNT